MKKILAFLFISLFFISDAMPQKANFFLAGGYNITKPNLDGLNFVTGRYNDTRTILTKNMEEFNSLGGFTVTAGVILNDIAMFDLTYIRKTGDVFAEGVVNDTNFRRDLAVSMNSVNLSGGVIVLSSNSIKTIIGASVDIGSVGTKTRVYPLDQSKPSYESTDDYVPNPISNMIFGLTPFAQVNINPGLSSFEIMIKPYYQFMINESDFKDVNRVLNPVTFTIDDPEQMVTRANNYGVEVKLSVFFDD